MRNSYWLPAILIVLSSYQLEALQLQSLGQLARGLQGNEHLPTDSRTTGYSPAFAASDFGKGPDAAAKEGQKEADQYFSQVQELFSREQFGQIDYMASAARSGKTRFAGGGWKLYTLYLALAAPADAAAPAEAWEAHLSALKEWTRQSPSSITARVTLAMAYLNYAWKARGVETSDKVTEDGWRLFAERAQHAREILDDASHLAEKCPQWYRAMQTVALAQGWNRHEADELLKDAVAFEPGYFYYYRAHAYYLLPKWHGEPGEAESFADRVSRKVGGEQGEVLYFEIAAELICGCNNEVDLQTMSWPRIQDGYATVARLYGASTYKLNQLAYMAVQMKDSEIAEEAFERIGENWNKSVWKTQNNFYQSRGLTGIASEGAKVSKLAETAVAANLNTPQGREYDATVGKEFENLGSSIQDCVQHAGGNLPSFNLYLLVGQNGYLRRIVDVPRTFLSGCVMAKMHGFSFSPPPAPDYWVKRSMNFSQ